jgi:hypothetical protein
MQQQQATGIQIKTAFFPLSWGLFFCTPTIVIDNQPMRKSWGTTFFPTQPGQHTIKIFFRYMWIAECSAAAATGAVQPGQVTNITYYKPPILYSPGLITQG